MLASKVHYTFGTYSNYNNNAIKFFSIAFQINNYNAKIIHFSYDYHTNICALQYRFEQYVLNMNDKTKHQESLLLKKTSTF